MNISYGDLTLQYSVMILYYVIDLSKALCFTIAPEVQNSPSIRI